MRVSIFAVSWAIASASPVTILTFTPICRAVAMVALASPVEDCKKTIVPRNALAPQPWRMKRRRGTQAVEGIKGGPETDGSARRSTKATATAMMATC
jgi:hypothetical protein